MMEMLVRDKYKVAPHVGAWIEIFWMSAKVFFALVAPHVGAWIEIGLTRWCYASAGGRSSCRSVD